MRAPTFAELPPPPTGKTGWPWTMGDATGDAFQDKSLEEGKWPKITIVTPSYNQRQFIEETIRSILLQGYPNLEYFIMDGGSTDETVSIIKKYEPWIAGWVSAKDGGQADAINKGWQRATGEILAWLNSDDWYQPNALWSVAQFFASHPDGHWLVGAVDSTDSPQQSGRRFKPRPTSLAQCLGRRDYGFHQPGVFWRRRLVDAVGWLDTSLHYDLDHDFWIRSLLLHFEPVCTETCLAGFRLHADSKSCSMRQAFLKEDWAVLRRYQRHLSTEQLAQARRWLSGYEAEALLGLTYGFLADHQRGKALRQLVSVLRVFPFLRPPTLGLGVLYRTLITGKPPAWFRR